MELPASIQQRIGNQIWSVDTVGMSDSHVICFDDMVLKIEKQQDESDNEHRMMAWLADKLPVPEILCLEKMGGNNYLLMSKLCGEMSCSAVFLENPQLLIALLVEGLRTLWEVDTAQCPSNQSIENKLKLAENRVVNHLCSIDDVEPETYGKKGFASPEHLLKWLQENKPIETLVFSHGDYCLPNIFLNNNKISGFIDLGRSGTADRYQDIALCYRSLKHNFDGAYSGQQYEGFYPEMLFDALEMKADWDLIRYYTLLDELF